VKYTFPDRGLIILSTSAKTQEDKNTFLETWLPVSKNDTVVMY